MEDKDDDAEMAPDYGTDFSDDVDPNFQVDAIEGTSTTLGNRESDTREWGA